MAGLVERAVAREIAPTELSLGVVHRDGQPTGEQILTVPADRLFPTEVQSMRVAPLGRAGDDHDARWEPGSFATGPLEPLRHVVFSPFQHDGSNLP